MELQNQDCSDRKWRASAPGQPRAAIPTLTECPHIYTDRLIRSAVQARLPGKPGICRILPRFSCFSGSVVPPESSLPTMRRASTSSCNCCSSASFRRSTSVGSFMQGSPRRVKSCKHFTGRRRSGKRHRGTGLDSVSEMVRMPPQDSERPIHLFQQDHPRHFVRQGHLSERKRQVGFSAQFVAEAVGWPNRKHQRRGVTVLMLTQKTGQFFG